MSKEISFVKQGDIYVADAKVNNDYSLHIERVSAGSFNIRQRSTDSGLYMKCKLPDILEWPGQIIDYSFSHGVYPKNIRIESGSQVTTAILMETEQ